MNTEIVALYLGFGFYAGYILRRCFVFNASDTESVTLFITSQIYFAAALIIWAIKGH